MKRSIIIILSFLFICLLFAYGLNAQHGIVVFGKDTLCINNINLENISHGEDEVSLNCVDTIMKRRISELDSISILKIPELLVIEQGIGDWSEMRMCSDGTVVLTRMEDENIPSEMMMMCPDDSLGAIFSKITFDENAYPVEITMNENKILVDWIDETQFNITILSPDSISMRFDSLSYTVEPSENGRQLVPDIDKKPWLTRVGGVLELVGGGIGTIGGAVMMVGSAALEAFSAGSSTPISIPGIVIGYYNVKSGLESLYNGFINAFTNNYEIGDDKVIETLSSQAATTTFERAVVPNLPNKLFPYLVDSKYKINDLYSFIPTALGDVVANLNRPYTWFDLVADVQMNVFTGLAMDTTMNSITVSGYVNPYILESPSVRFETEYGIIIYSEENPQERYVQNDYDGAGGMFGYIFDELKPNTTYSYFTYYIDMTNQVVAIAKSKSFKTIPLLPVIKDFKITNKEYSENAFTHDGVTYDYKFDVELTVEIEDEEGVTDWGYVYRDPNGHDKKISLMEYGTRFTDDRYVYYRNGNISSVTFFVYIKYEEDKTARYGEPIDYYLVSNTCPDDNHPHIIDLGLPSGTKWACCNVDAPKPEGYGGRYAWGETWEKEEYIWATYSLRENLTNIDPISGWYDAGTYIGEDISGTEYDVAHVKWGEPWRMPSFDQYFELATECSGGWTNYNGVYGFVFIGSNDNSIFLPAGEGRDSMGAYWASTFWHGGDGRFAEYFDFGSYGYGYDWEPNHWDWYWNNISLRSDGLYIRAVYNSGDFNYENDEDDEEDEEEYEEDETGE